MNSVVSFSQISAALTFVTCAKRALKETLLAYGRITTFVKNDLTTANSKYKIFIL